eukprot:381770-Amphidinium_carterae.4
MNGHGLRFTGCSVLGVMLAQDIDGGYESDLLGGGAFANIYRVPKSLPVLRAHGQSGSARFGM